MPEEKKEAPAPKQEPKGLTAPTSNDVGVQTKTKADKAKEK